MTHLLHMSLHAGTHSSPDRAPTPPQAQHALTQRLVRTLGNGSFIVSVFKNHSNSLRSFSLSQGFSSPLQRPFSSATSSHPPQLSSVLCKSHHRSGRRQTAGPTDSPQDRPLAVEMEAAWSPPVLTTPAPAEEEVSAARGSFRVAVNCPRLKSPFPLTLGPTTFLCAQQKHKNHPLKTKPATEAAALW